MITGTGKRGRAAVVALAWMVGLSGCSTGSGARFSSSGPNRLSTWARELREQSSPPAAIPRELDKQMAPPYMIEPGDVLLVQPANLDSPLRLPGDQVVLPDGTIQLGQFGHLVVAGKTLPVIEGEVNAIIKARVADAGPIIVRLVTRDSKVFYVLGEVNAPGAFPLRGRETVLDAIIAGGGLTSNASRRNILLSRPTAPNSCRLVLPVQYNDIVQLGDTTTNYQIKAGDRVFVPTRGSHEDRRARKQEKKDCNPHALCPPGECGPAATMSKPVPVGAPDNPAAFMGAPLPGTATGPEMIPPPKQSVPDDALPAPTGSPQPGYQPLRPPGR